MIRDPEALTRQRWDLLVVGGGIHGLFAAYDAAVLAGTGTAWVNSVRGALASAYASFQTANVATGNFQSAATGILGGVGAASLTF